MRSFSVVAGSARRYDNDVPQGRISTADGESHPGSARHRLPFYGARMHATHRPCRPVVDFGPLRSTNC